MGDLDNIACTLRAIEQLLRDMRDVLREIRDSTGPTAQLQMCNCTMHTPGAVTGGWFCPVHGQRF